MRFLYLTDFHGDKGAYESAFTLAVSLECDAVVNGGDVFPKTALADFALDQRRFWETWLLTRMARLEDKGIRNYMMFGNDDARGIINILDEAHEDGIITRLDGKGWLPFGDYWILGFPYVPDYPFRLKDWCHGDINRVPCAGQLGSPLFSGMEGFLPMAFPWKEELQIRPTLREMLAGLPVPPDPERAVFCMHSPPYGIGLDVCSDNRVVGSQAAREHILDRQYLISLHGHIHESPRVTQRWHGKLGRTTCVQPGAWPPSPLLVDLDARLITHQTFGFRNFGNAD